MSSMPAAAASWSADNCPLCAPSPPSLAAARSFAVTDHCRKGDDLLGPRDEVRGGDTMATDNRPLKTHAQAKSRIEPYAHTYYN